MSSSLFPIKIHLSVFLWMESIYFCLLCWQLMYSPFSYLPCLCSYTTRWSFVKIRVFTRNILHMFKGDHFLFRGFLSPFHNLLNIIISHFVFRESAVQPAIHFIWSFFYLIFLSIFFIYIFFLLYSLPFSFYNSTLRPSFSLSFVTSYLPLSFWLRFCFYLSFRFQHLIFAFFFLFFYC